MQPLIQPIRRPTAVHGVRRALVGILATFVGTAACDQEPDNLPTSPSIVWPAMRINGLGRFVTA